MRAEEYLEQVYYLDKRISGDLDELKRLNELSTSITACTLSKARVQGGKKAYDKVGEIIAKIDMLAENIFKELDELEDLRTKIRGQILEMESKVDRLILTYRYINFWGWENIARELDCSERWIYKLRSGALRRFQEKFL